MVDKLNAEHATKGINVHVTAHLEVGETMSSLIAVSYTHLRKAWIRAKTLI